MSAINHPRALGAEFIGTAFLLATVVGSGIMAETLAGGNIAIALLGNTIPTGAILFVLTTILGPVSGAHFNPAVTFVFWLRNEISTRVSVGYVFVQILGGILGVLVAHVVFDDSMFQLSQKARTGGAQWFSEGVATFGLLMTILGAVRYRAESVAAAVGLYITAAYWFSLDFFCQSGRDHRAQFFGYVRRYQCGAHARICSGATSRSSNCLVNLPMVVFGIAGLDY